MVVLAEKGTPNLGIFCFFIFFFYEIKQGIIGEPNNKITSLAFN